MSCDNCVTVIYVGHILNFDFYIDTGVWNPATCTLDCVPLDISGSPTVLALFRNPVSGAIVTGVASIITNGTGSTEALIRYTTVEGDLSVEGDWEARAEVAERQSSTIIFSVEARW